MIAAYDSEHDVTHQDDDARFLPTTSDVDLIETLKLDNPVPVFLTADTNQRRRPEERIALASSGLMLVFFKSGWHQYDAHTQAVKLLERWPDIVRETSRSKEPTAFEISGSGGKVERLCRTIDLLPRR